MMESTTTLPANNLVALKFIPEFSDAKYEMFEVENDIAQKIIDGGSQTMIIKSYVPPVKREVVELIGQ